VADFGLTEDMYATMYYRQEKSNGSAEERPGLLVSDVQANNLV